MPGIGQQVETTVTAAGLSGRTGDSAITIQAGGSGRAGIIAIPAIIVVSPQIDTGTIAGKPVSRADNVFCNLRRGRGGCDQRRGH